VHLLFQYSPYNHFLCPPSVPTPTKMRVGIGVNVCICGDVDRGVYKKWTHLPPTPMNLGKGSEGINKNSIYCAI
jgi:hypothetical protein